MYPSLPPLHTRVTWLTNAQYNIPFFNATQLWFLTVEQALEDVVTFAMNFTLPAAAQGPSIEAEVSGPGQEHKQDIVFPLGPDLILSWASCSLKITPARTKLFRCDLKPGYRFQ